MVAKISKDAANQMSGDSNQQSLPMRSIGADTQEHCSSHSDELRDIIVVIYVHPKLQESSLINQRLCLIHSPAGLVMLDICL